jgi:hypothetical protein
MDRHDTMVALRRKEKEDHVLQLSRNWQRVMLAALERRDAGIQRDSREPFGEELIRCHEGHYDELLDKIIELASRKPNRRHGFARARSG